MTATNLHPYVEYCLLSDRRERLTLDHETAAESDEAIARLESHPFYGVYDSIPLDSMNGITVCGDLVEVEGLYVHPAGMSPDAFYVGPIPIEFYQALMEWEDERTWRDPDIDHEDEELPF